MFLGLSKSAVIDQGAPPAPAAPSPVVAAPPADGSAAAPPAAPPAEPQGLRQLREQYETTKRERDQWSSLGKYDEVSGHLKTFSAIRTEATELANSLGYAPEDLQSAFQKDPIATLQFLRQKAAEATPAPLNPNDLKKQLDKMVEERLKPITQREDQRMIKEAEFRFDGEFDRLFKETFKDGLPEECREAIKEMAGQLLGDDAEAIKRLKFEGQVSDVQKYFQEAQTRFLKVVNAYLGHERKRVGGDPPPKPGEPVPPKTWKDRKLSTGQDLGTIFNV